MYDVVALGELLIDFTPAGKSESGQNLYEQNPGGAPANVLATVTKFGGKTAFIGKVGDDLLGEFLKKTLMDIGIDCKGLIMDKQFNTTLAFVMLDEHGDRNFQFYRNYGADTKLKSDEINLELIENAKIFHFGTLSMTNSPAYEATVKAVEHAKQKGITISFDPNYREKLWEDENKAIDAIKQGMEYADIVKLSLEEAQMVTGYTDSEQCIKFLSNYDIKLLIITMGEEGSIYCYKNIINKVEAYSQKVVDTTGAGDIFFGSVLSGIVLSKNDIYSLKIQNIESILKKAAVIAGISVGKRGAIPSIPIIEQIN